MTERRPPTVRPIGPDDGPRLRQLILDRWGSTRMVARSRLFEPADDAGFVALDGDGEWLSYGTYHFDDSSVEVTLLDSPQPGRGGGGAVLDAIAAEARRIGASRLWLITTNDNLDALGFYQRRGWVIAAIHRDAVAAARRLKPEIPLVAANGIPIRDEIELELPPGR